MFRKIMLKHNIFLERSPNTQTSEHTDNLFLNKVVVVDL